MAIYNRSKMIGLSLIACLGLVSSLEAGKIGPVADQAAPSHSSGFGGFDYSNIDIKITDLDYNEIPKAFDTTDGSYDAMTYGDSFEGDIYDSVDQSGEVIVKLHGKDWPVGEPGGIKVIHGNSADHTLSHNKPASCIMTTSFVDLVEDDGEGMLDEVTPTETLCWSPFQTHKRFKLNMLPTMIDTAAAGEYGEGVNLSFNVEADADTWRYMILQKVNNYTGKRLDGYKVEVGFLDVDGNFTTASAAGADIRLSIGTGEGTDGANIWEENELATFSHGLFGPADGDHFLTDGFFDKKAAGFTVVLADTNDTITSTGTLGSNYVSLPVPLGAVDGQFGSWLTEEWAPHGIFWDDDNDPLTDAMLMAFWGDLGDGNYTWMKGNNDAFQEATVAELFGWASDPVYTVGEIEDVLNLGLNYIVEVGDISTFPVSKFTIRITPHVAADQTEPGYVTNTPPPLSEYITSEGSVAVSPSPEFTIGDTLNLVVADLDLNNSVTLDVNVSVDGTWKMITLDEVAGRSIFTAALATIAGATPAITDSNITVMEGSVVTVAYTDADNGSTGEAVVTATTTAATTPTAPPPGNNDSADGFFSTMDNVSLFALIAGLLAIGALIARRKLAK
ncbi:MAG: choice-of-anchor F family protein [Campylobacterota bacterium]